ncbi:MAG: Protease LasA [Chloroflexi bacterium]|nr:Protease LasA [Chloroflexota bacterium]
MFANKHLKSIIFALTFLLAGCRLVRYNPPTFVAVSETDTPTVTPSRTPSPTIPATLTTTRPPTQTFTPSPTGTARPTLTPSPTPWVNAEEVLYYAQAGDTLEVVAAHFGTKPEDVESPDPIPSESFISPGQLLVIPHGLVNTTSEEQLLPDSEVVYSPSAANFDVVDYVNEAGGYLSTYSDYLGSIGQASGGEIVALVAKNNSINPRLLLALLEYQSGWVFGEPRDLRQERYPLNYVDYKAEGLLAQLRWAVNELSIGYYGWREGRVLEISLEDTQNPSEHVVARVAPSLNAGTVALQYYFSQIYESTDWVHTLNPDGGFTALYNEMFGDPWVRAQNVEPLFPPDLKQPEMRLPFLRGPYWSYTGGPHGAWEHDGSWAAIDFAPVTHHNEGCLDTNAWVAASLPGRVVRSHYGLVVIDFDEDGSEQTGWVVIYLHVREEGRVQDDERVERGDLLGHPSCEGGWASGTHVHMARKYNGEWIAADGPVPFVLSGWRVHRGLEAYQGTLTREGKVVEASLVGADPSSIHLELLDEDDEG